MTTHVDDRIREHRNATDRLLKPVAANTADLEFTNPGPGKSVLAEDYLSHLDLDHPDIRAILAECYPSITTRPKMLAKAEARLRFVAWMTLAGHDNPHAAHAALKARPDAVRKLGFPDGLPSYETLRDFWYDRLTPTRQAALKHRILADTKRRHPRLGRHQAQDCTPAEGRRDDSSLPYSPYYETRMHRAELRWDVEHEALLADQYYDGLAHEGRWLNVLNARVEDAGVHPQTLTVDNGYASRPNHAATWRTGTRLLYRQLEQWRLDPEVRAEDVESRYRKHWRHDAWTPDADRETMLRFLIDHGSDRDVEAAGAWLRDEELSGRSDEDEALRRRDRSGNEGLNGEYKRLPTTPDRRGALALFRRHLACTLTLMLVQWTRVQNGVRTGLCRTGYIV